MSEEKKVALVKSILKDTIYYDSKDENENLSGHPGVTASEEFFIEIKRMYDCGYKFQIPKAEHIDVTGFLSSSLSRGKVYVSDACRFIGNGKFNCHPVYCPFSQNRLKERSKNRRTTSILKKECCFPFIVNPCSFNTHVKEQQDNIIPGIRKRGGNLQINMVFIENVNFDRI